MEVFTSNEQPLIDLSSLQAILAEWDIPPIRAIEAVGDAHAVFKVSTAASAFTLKDISDAPDLLRLSFTDSVLRHVASAGLQVPLPLRSRSAQLAVPFRGRFYLLSAFIEAGEYPRAPELQAELFFHTGQAIASLHLALASYPDPMVHQQTWREDLAGHVGLWMSALGAGLPEAEAAIVRRVARSRGATITSALRGLPEHLIHRDCHPGNILVDGTRVIGFIDCDHFCIGPRLFDLAYYAVHHLKWVTDDSAATERWLINLPHLLAGYESHQRLLPGETAALPYAMLAYHLLLSYWFMGLPRPESIGLEVRALDWLDRHFAAITAAATSRIVEPR